MEHFVVYSRANGAILWRGKGDAGIAAGQQLEEGLEALTVPEGFLTTSGYDFAVMRGHLCDLVDAAAEKARSAVLTVGAGQAMEYAEVAAEAEASVSGGGGPFPLLQASIDAGELDPRTGEAVSSLGQAAEVVLYARERWIQAAAAIREERLRAKSAIRSADENFAALAEIVAAAELTFASIA